MLKSIIGRTKRNEKHTIFEYTGNNEQDIPTNVTHVRVLHGVTKINDRVLRARSRLVSITLPSTVVEIDNYIFQCNPNLKEVVFNNGIEKIGSAAFCKCRSLENITFPSTLTEIDDNAFYDCTNLRTVVLNEGLKYIRYHGFAGCTSLQSVTFPSTLTAIGPHAFKGCNRLREIVILSESLNHGISIIKQAMVACISVRKLNFRNLSIHLENVIKINHWSNDIEDKMDAIPQIVRRDNGGFLISTRDRGNMVDWKLVRKSFVKMYKLISYYELKEFTSLFELALWKAKIDQVDDVVDPAIRDAYRIEVPGPVKDTILQYLR